MYDVAFSEVIQREHFLSTSIYKLAKMAYRAYPCCSACSGFWEALRLNWIFH